MTLEVVSLHSEACLDPARVGAKAARLAAALRRGHPVLAGEVIPVEVSAALLAAAAQRTAAAGVHAAQLEVMESATPDLSGLVPLLQSLGDDLAVRSSSPLESASDYAGTFTSYLGVTAAEAATAVRGVWASALTADPPGVAAHGAAATRAGPLMAVLVQRQVHPLFSGTAQLADGVVTITAVTGSPAPLLAGWSRGDTARVGPDGAEGAAVGLLGEATVLEVAGLVRHLHGDLGDDLVEWASTDAGVILLQAKRAAPRTSRQCAEAVPARVPPAAAGIARLVHAFAGPLGEQLVLPILLAGVSRRTTAPTSVATAMAHVSQADAASAWTRARALSRSLEEGLWAAAAAPGGAAAALADLRGGAIDAAADQLAACPAARPEDARQLVRELEVVAAWLGGAGIIGSPDDLWALPTPEVARLLTGDARGDPSQRGERRRRALLRWEPFLHTTVNATGTVLLGEGVAPGVAAGVGVLVRGLPVATTPMARMVLIAPHPIPQLAPLLWGAAGLVTSGGGAGAHLVEVARSRGVPAVVGCDENALFSLVRAGHATTLVSVDGDSGRVAIDAHP